MMTETYTERADAICRSNQTYQQKKADAQAISCGELAEIQDSLYALAKQTGLVRQTGFCEGAKHDRNRKME